MTGILAVRSLFAVALAAVALAAGLVAAGPAPATVPPKDCGILRVEGSRYTIKADQLRCGTARGNATGYLRTRRRPAGYRCRDYRASKLVFRCSRGVRVFFAIKR